MEERLQHQKIPKLLFTLAIPSICGQIITLIYNMVDRMYIGRLPDGALAMAAIGLCVPLTTIITAFNGLFGRGGAPLSSILLGEKKKKESNNILTTSFICLVITSFIITTVVWLFQNPLLYLFGANQETIQYARDYISIYALGTIFIQLTVGLNYFVNAQGYTRFSMLTVLLGAGLNIILDPLFIYQFNMGVKGAAIATVLSQAVSCLFVIGFFLGKKTILRIQFNRFRIKWSVLKRILMLGSSPFFMSASEGLLTICFNQQLLSFGGSLAVSAMTIMTSMYQFVLLPIEGVASGSQPIISYNYGAKNYQRCKETISLAMKATCLYSLVIVLLMELFPQIFVGIFTSDSELLRLGSWMLRIYILGGCIMGINSTCQQSYNSLGEGKMSFFFAFYRKIILLIPLIFILPMFFENQVLAVVLAEPISDFITTITNYIYFHKIFLLKKLSVNDIEKEYHIVQEV